LALFTTSDGTRIAYDDLGSGRPLVLLHGLMAHRGFFEPQRELAGDFRVISIDLRGHGDSGRNGLAPTVEQLADDVASLAEELGLKDAVVVGWSLGASVSWHLLTGRASRIFAGAVVVDMTARVLNEDGWELGLSSEQCEARRIAIRDDFQTFAHNAGQAIFAQPVRDDLRETALWAGSEFAANDAETISAVWASLVGQDFRPLLGRIDKPTLILHGGQSQLYGSDTAEHLEQALPNATAIEFSRSGHAPHLEQPELFNQTIRNFAASLPRVSEHQEI
jgi:pimeloyl-ACP methyl ester carboxylesterase